ncbi:arylamine N-acetyltransferase family protein [Nocardia nova]|uniref:arylamine N-acetyltransferase family protein n=1 Tax=Nocardia nova TaxID=37330 RepID=UPI0007A3E7FD|nr:arylamine N-acetyltransferase [Nocardia nova]
MHRDDYLRAYLRRIGADGPLRPDVDTLRYLHERHLIAIPFENIDFHLKTPIDLGADVFPKIVDRGRGGACAELNSAFEVLLRHIGFDDIHVMAGRAFDRDTVLPSLAHFVLVVRTPEPYLVDLGFLRGSRFPLRFDVRTPQTDPEGEFQICDNPDGTIDLLRNGYPQYRLEKRRLRFSAFPAGWWATSAPDVPASQKLMCSILTESGRITMLDQHTLIESDASGVRRTELTEAWQVLALYKDAFGLPFDELPLPTAALS